MLSLCSSIWSISAFRIFAEPTDDPFAGAAQTPDEEQLLSGSENVVLICNGAAEFDIEYNDDEPLSVYTNMTGGTLTWSSSDSSVAYVDSDDLLWGVSYGHAVITATVTKNGVSYSDTIDVYVHCEFNNGIYYIRNRQTTLAVTVYESSPYVKAERYYGCSKSQWMISYAKLGCFTIRSMNSSGTYSYLASSSGNPELVTTSTITNNLLWKLTPTQDGAFVLKSYVEGLSSCLCPTSTSYSSSCLFFNDYVNSGSNNDWCDEWVLVPANTGRGAQIFRPLYSNEIGALNCLTYALQLDISYSNNMNVCYLYQTEFIEGAQDVYYYGLWLSAAKFKTNYESKAEGAFQNIINHPNSYISQYRYSIEREYNFTGNGQNNLSDNQFRIVMKFGEFPGYTRCGDYHFWYQTYNGRWANKHGDGDLNYSRDYLPRTITPYSTNTSGWSIVEGQYFYSSNTVYSFIITINPIV